MITGIDYAWGRPGGRRIKLVGFDFVCRYLSHSPLKNISNEEAEDLHAHDLKIVLVWETSAKRALKGYEAGKNDATEAWKLSRTVRFPEDKPIYFAVDFDLQPSQILAVNNYFKGLLQVFPISRVGVYGGLATVQHLFDSRLIKYAWQTCVWSHNVWDFRIHIKQVDFHFTLNGATCDRNQAVQLDYGQW